MTDDSQVALCAVLVGNVITSGMVSISAKSRALFRQCLTIKNNATMKRPNLKKYTNKRFCHQLGNQELYKFTFIIGELYLFHPTKKYCPSRSSLWGIYDKIEDNIIYLESSTLDLHNFSIWHRLPEGYRYARRATRRELRDYMYNLGHSDSQMWHINTRRQLLKMRPQSSLVHPHPRHSFTRMINGNA